MIPPMLGRPGWYVTTIGTRVLVFGGRGVNASSLVLDLAFRICSRTYRE